MATNPYFSQGTRPEQTLYEDLIVESLKMYGQDVNYMPRELVNVDTILVDDVPSSFSKAYQIEMYIENVDGFDGEGDIFTKFGIEIRDQATFIVARRRWNAEIAPFEAVPDIKPFYRPREGDLIHLPLSNSIFQIMRVEDESPFYQLKNLPTFRMFCELFEYSGEDFDTNIAEIDDVESAFAYQTVLTLDSAGIDSAGSNLTSWQRNEIVTQTFDSDGYSVTGEVVDWDRPNLKLYLANVGNTDSAVHSFTTTKQIIGSISTKAATPTLVEQLQSIQTNAQNSTFDTEEQDFMDFSENNPFGDPE
jgi:hypothetical protein|tara:strand:- start:2227 stop:3141 length:915 start_codon:yes stop_codon:yes gene_type:complete